MTYVACEDIKGKSIATYIIDILNNTGIDPKNCRSQTYDGARNMAGKLKGAANQFQVMTGSDRAPYVHCASHQLNLCLSKASKVARICNKVSTMHLLGLLEKCIEDMTNEDVSFAKHKIKPLCETRWVERHTAFNDLASLYDTVLLCLEKIFLNTVPDTKFDPHSVTEASGLHRQLESSSFLIAFKTCHYIFGFTEGLSKQLQGSSMEIVSAYSTIPRVTEELENVRRNAATEFLTLYKSAVEMANKCGNTIDVPRLSERQTLRCNVSDNTTEEYFRRAIFIPFLDSLVTEFNSRFSGKALDMAKGMYLIPSNLSELHEHQHIILNYFVDDLPNSSAFSQEIRLWISFWSKRANVLTTITETLQSILKDHEQAVFPNILRILNLLLTTSVTSASVERANSALAFVKNDYRSTMTQDRFNAWVLLFVHRDITIDYEKVINIFSSKYPRRMLRLNALGEQ